MKALLTVAFAVAAMKYQLTSHIEQESFDRSTLHGDLGIETSRNVRCFESVTSLGSCLLTTGLQGSRCDHVKASLSLAWSISPPTILTTLATYPSIAISLLMAKKKTDSKAAAKLQKKAKQDAKVG